MSEALAESANPVGRRTFISGAAAAAATTSAVALTTSAEAASTQLTRYQALPPLRLCDTRPGRSFGFTRAGAITRVKIAGRTINGVTVPADATAAVFTLVGINRTFGNNFLSAFPTGNAWPGTSSLNMTYLNAIEPNLVTTRLGNGSVDVLADGASDVILDLAGVYVPSPTGREKAGRFREISPGRRVLDTRNSGGKPGRDSTVRVDLTGLVGAGVLDADAEAVSVNITAAQVTNSGYLTTYAFGDTLPETSSLNVVRGQNRAIGAMVKIGRDSNGRVGFNIFIKNGCHVLVDATGFITGPSASTSSTGLFVPVNPTRLMDTRRGHGGKKRLWPRWTREFSLPSQYAAEAGSAVINLTAARTMGPGFFSVNAARTRVGTPTVSSLNVSAPGQNIANHVVSNVSTAGLECYSQSGGDLIADLVGYYKGSRRGASAPIPVDPPPPGVAPPYFMRIPSILRMQSGRSTVSGASSTAVVNSGRIWHWAGTAYVGNGRYNIATFGHRTDAGGPLYYSDQIGPGALAYMSTTDQRTYVYEYAGRELTSDSDAQILAATRRITGEESLSVIACTVGFDSTKSRYPDQWAPTSLKYRIVVRFRFKSWSDDIPLIP